MLKTLTKNFKKFNLNKIAHFTNGNKNSVIKSIQVMEINKDSSNILINLEALRLHIYEQNPTIVAITESNFKIDENLSLHFKYYDIIETHEDNHTMDRIILLMKKETII